MITISMVNIKGGVGKTTSVVNISACLNRYHKKRVLIIDCDAQINATSYVLMEDIPQKTIKDIMKRAKAVDVIVDKNWAKTSLSIIPGDSTIDLLSVNSIDKLYEALQDVSDNYDFCLIDCPPHLSDICLSAIRASDYVLVPALPDTDSLGGYSLLIDAITNIRNNTNNGSLEILGVFFNAVSKESLDQYIVDECRKGFGDSLFKATIRRSTVVKQCRYFGLPVCEKREKSEINNDYKLLTKQIIQRLKKWRKEA